MSVKPYDDKDWLYEEYIIKNKSMKEIAKTQDIGRKAISRRLNKFDIEKKNIGKKLPHYVVDTCTYCFTNFFTERLTYRRSVDPDGKRFCNRECFREYKREEMTGEGNHNYGGTYHGTRYHEWSKEKQRARTIKTRQTRLENGTMQERGSLEVLNMFMRRTLKGWTQNVLENSDYTCDVTGIRGGQLQAHHLKPLHEIRDEILREYNIKPKATIVEYSDDELDTLEHELRRRHTLANGVTLEKRVHEIFHKEYGYKCCPEDYYEFKRRYHSGEFTDEHE